MRFSLSREAFLKPLQQVVGVVERRQTLPVLSNLLVQVQGVELALTGTDLEVEMVARAVVEDAEPGETTIPARKLYEIVRASARWLPRHRFESAATRPRSRPAAAASPSLPCRRTTSPRSTPSKAWNGSRSPKVMLKDLIERSAFAMAQQDVRYYLNGLLLRPARRQPALRGHGWSPPGPVRSGSARREVGPSGRSSCRARACSNCSGCSRAASASSNSNWHAIMCACAART
ncbi:MAG: hypothetical protein KatS3mg127_0538 [Silanimonas sp.]|nr:MAG: hypothetical protein KatS3mg127_0538 [Silanimonas sp.]